MIDRAALGAALRSARESLGLSATYVAERVGCSERHIRRLESREAPLDIPRIEELCIIYNTHPMKIIGAGYHKSAAVVLTTNLTRECKKMLHSVIDAIHRS